MWIRVNRMGLFKKFIREGWWSPPEIRSIDFSSLNESQLKVLLNKHCLQMTYKNIKYEIRIPRFIAIENLETSDISVEIKDMVQ